MDQELKIASSPNKADKYAMLLPQLRHLIENEKDRIANLANIAAALMQTFSFLWVGFYLVKDDQLVLGPFQGPVACTRISKGKGVCGKAWEEKRAIIVPDVNQFPGHIACSSASRSEIVIPIFNQGELKMVLDVDSEQADYFDDIDVHSLGEVTKLIEGLL